MCMRDTPDAILSRLILDQVTLAYACTRKQMSIAQK